MAFKFFWFWFNPRSSGKIEKPDLKNPIKMPIIRQNLNMNNFRTRNTQSLSNCITLERLLNVPQKSFGKDYT